MREVVLDHLFFLYIRITVTEKDEWIIGLD